MRLVNDRFTVKVNEIFYSIQGESTYSGMPCIFIRLSGCNLRCSWCDTTYAYDQGFDITIDDILKQVKKFNCRLVEVTGGEPLLQAGTPVLIERLLNKGYEVLLETNGSLDTTGIDKRCIKIIDVKCPSSGESKKNRLENLKRLTPLDQVKFVIKTKDDYDFAKKILKEIPGISGNRVLFSPVSKKLKPSLLAEWILDDGLKVRLHLQIHKIVWPDIKKGV